MTPICHMMEVGSNGKRTWSASTALPEQKWQQVITAYDRAQKAITSVSGISSPSVVDQCRPNSASSWGMINGIGVQVSTDLNPRCTWINSTDILQRHYLSISLNLPSTDLFNHHCVIQCLFLSLLLILLLPSCIWASTLQASAKNSRYMMKEHSFVVFL